MKFITSICLAALSILVHAQASGENEIIGQPDSVFSADLDSYVNIIIYEPDNMIPDGKVTPIVYVFGDFLFETFSGSINYLHNKMELIPNCVLIGINEIPKKHIGPFQQEYTGFITQELMESLSARYNLNTNGILFGHSRATRLVAKVIQENPEYINQFILSAPWFTEEHLVELENSFSKKSEMISIYYTLSEEDLAASQIQDAKENFTDFLEKHPDVVQAKYLYFDGETHMSIPPLSFYYGVKYLLKN